MKTWLLALGLVLCISLIAVGRPNARTETANMSEDDFRKLEQAWLDAASVPDLPALRKMFSDDFMGTSFGAGVLSKHDVVPPEATRANHMPKSILKDSTVRIFGDTAVLGTLLSFRPFSRVSDCSSSKILRLRSETLQANRLCDCMTEISYLHDDSRISQKL